MADLLHINEDAKVTMTGLSYTSDAGVLTYLNAATITYTLTSVVGTTTVGGMTVPGTTVSGGTGTLSYVAASNGNYTGTIDKAVTSLLSDGSKYYLYTPIAEGSRDGFRRLELRAEYRGAT